VTLELTASRVVDGDVDATFSRVLPMPLEQLFVRWYGPLPPIRATEGPLPWQTPGQQRRVDLAGPGSMRETLTEVEPPHHFSYRLDDIRGPMEGLIAAVDGRWAFAPNGAGTTITWSWSVSPAWGDAVAAAGLRSVLAGVRRPRAPAARRAPGQRASRIGNRLRS